MMMRSDDNATVVEGCTAEELLACIASDNYDECVASCGSEKEPTTGNGLITLSKVGSTSVVETPVDAINVKIGSIKLTAGEYDTRVSSVELTESGLGYFDTDELEVYLVNENVETDVASVSKTSKKVKVKFSPALTIKAGQSETFDVMVNVFTNLENASYNFAVSDVVVANGKVEGTPVSLGGIKTTSAVSESVEVTLDNGASTVKAGDTQKLLAKLNVNFNKVGGTLRRFSLLNIETPTDKLGDAFENINAYVNGEKVGKVSFDDDKITVSNLNISKSKDEEVSIELKADVKYDEAEADFMFELNTIAIDQAGYNFGLVPSTWPTQNSSINVKGNNITFKKVALTTKEFLPGTRNIVVYNATFKSAIDARITNATIEGNTELTTDILSADSAKIVIAGEDIELDDSEITTSALNISLSNLKIDVDANSEVAVQIVLSTKKPLSGDPVVDVESTYKVTLEGRGLENVNNTFTTTTVAGDKVTIKEGAAVIAAATVSAPATRSLFPNKEQEAGRFSIEADGDELTVNELTLGYTTTLSNDDFESLFDGNFSLVKVADTEEEIQATFELDKVAKTLKISDIKDFTIAKDETVNLKLMVNLSTLDTFYGESVKFSVKADSIDAKTSVRTLNTNVAVDLSSDYTMKMVAPEIELTKVSEKKFKVVIKNNDRDTAVAVEKLRYRVVTTVADSDFAGNVCLTDDASKIECSAGHAFGARGTELTTAETINARQSKTYYIVVDGTSIEPEVLQADISSLTYNGDAENYSVSVK